MNFNQVFIGGNVTRDPQLKYLPSQTPVVEFGIATNRKWRDKDGGDREEVTFVDCSAFGKTAEVINQYFRKGKPIFVSGRLKLDTWEDKQGGGKRSKMTVVIESFQFCGGDRQGDNGDDQTAPVRQQRPQRQPANDVERAFQEDQRTRDDDLPF